MIDKIGHYSLENPASQYDEEAMTALQLAARTAAKVNEAVEQVNRNEIFCRNMQEVVMPIEVSDQIDKRIDDGSFDAAIGEHLGDLNERMDNLENGIQPGSTTSSMDAEVIGLRLRFDNVQEETAGNGVRKGIRIADAHAMSALREIDYIPVTSQAGYLAESEAQSLIYMGTSEYYSVTTRRIPTSGGHMFYYKGTGRNEAISYAFLRDYSVVRWETVDASKNGTIVTVPMGNNINGVVFSSFANLADPAPVLEVKQVWPLTTTDKLTDSDRELQKLLDYYPTTSGDGYLSASGAFGGKGDYVHTVTDYIPVVPGDKFTFNTVSRGSAVSYVEFDESKQPVNSGATNTFEPVTVTYTAQNKGYVRLASMVSGNDLAKAPKMHVRYQGENAVNVRIKKAMVNASGSGANKLAGKHIVGLGDSIMAGDGNGGRGIVELLCEEYGCTGENHGVGGAYLSSKEADWETESCIVDQFDEITTTPDIVLICGGSNDIGGGYPPLEETDVELLDDPGLYYDTINEDALNDACRSLAVLIAKIQRNYTMAKILVIMPHSTTSRVRGYSAEFGADEVSLYRTLKAVCDMYGVPLVDVFHEGGINTRNAEHASAYTAYDTEGSTTHPNEAGYKFAYLPLIVDKLNSIM